MTRCKRMLACGLGVALLVIAGEVSAGSTNGRAGSMSAFYDGQLFTINFEEAVLAHNKSINIIYQSDSCIPEGQMMFVSVVDAIQGDGFNPLWQEVQIHFVNADFPCQQLTSDNDITAAAAEGLIALEPTTEVYRCAVLGPK